MSYEFLHSELITLNSELEEAEIIPKEPEQVMLLREKQIGTPCNNTRRIVFRDF